MHTYETKPKPKEKPKENTTGIPDYLKTNAEKLSGHSMDDVTVHYNSPLPQRYEAAAFTAGNDIHIAGGHEDSLAHELWHVVQQKEHRTESNLQLKAADIDFHPPLEAEADAKAQIMRSMQSGDSEQQNLIHTQPNSDVMQMEFLVHVEISTPKGDLVLDNTTFTADQLLVSSINMSKTERPPTDLYIEKPLERASSAMAATTLVNVEGNHTAAWSLVRDAQMAQEGKPLIDVLKWYDMMSSKLFGRGVVPAAAGTPNTIKQWNLMLTQVIRDYSTEYAKQPFATVNTEAHGGSGEAVGIKKLLAYEESLEPSKGTEPSVHRPTDFIETALSLFDFQALDELIKGTVREDAHTTGTKNPADGKKAQTAYIESLKASFPISMGLHGAVLEKAFLEIAATKSYTIARDEGKIAFDGGSAGISNSFIADIRLAPPFGCTGDRPYKSTEVSITVVNISDTDRPSTKFITVQKSHTVAWSFVRLYLHKFIGQSLLPASHELLNTIISSGEQPVALPGAKAEAQAMFANITGKVFPIYQWEILASDIFQLYARWYSLLPSASFGKHGEGRGEGTAVDKIVTGAPTEKVDGALDLFDYSVFSNMLNDVPTTDFPTMPQFTAADAINATAHWLQMAAKVLGVAPVPPVPEGFKTAVRGIESFTRERLMLKNLLGRMKHIVKFLSGTPEATTKVTLRTDFATAFPGNASRIPAHDVIIKFISAYVNPDTRSGRVATEISTYEGYLSGDSLIRTDAIRTYFKLLITQTGDDTARDALLRSFIVIPPP